MRLVNLLVGFRAAVGSDGTLNVTRCHTGSGSGRGSFKSGAAADRVPDLGLFLVDGCSFADARMNDGFRSCKLRAAGPAAVLNTEDVERERRRADGNDAILADDAILLAAAHELAGEQQQRAFTAIDQDKLVHGSAGHGLRTLCYQAITYAIQDLSNFVYPRLTY